MQAWKTQKSSFSDFIRSQMWVSILFISPGSWKLNKRSLSCPWGHPPAPGCFTSAVPVWGCVSGELELGQRLPHGPSAQPHTSVHQSRRRSRIRTNPGKEEDELPGRHAEARAEDRHHEEAAQHAGGTNDGNVDQGRDFSHQGQYYGEMESTAWTGSAPSHAQIHEHH